MFKQQKKATAAMDSEPSQRAKKRFSSLRPTVESIFVKFEVWI